MATKRYNYQGPVSGVTLNEGTADEPKRREVPLLPGKDVDLPEDNEYVRTLVALGHLTPSNTADSAAPIAAESATEAAGDTAANSVTKVRSR